MTSFYIVVALLALVFVSCQFAVFRTVRRYVFGSYSRLGNRKGLIIFAGLFVLNMFLAVMSMSSGWASPNSQAQKFLAVTFFTYLGVTAITGIFLAAIKTLYLTASLSVAGYRLLLIMISGDLGSVSSSNKGVDSQGSAGKNSSGESPIGVSRTGHHTISPRGRSGNVRPIAFGPTGVRIYSAGYRKIAAILTICVIAVFSSVGLYGVIEAYSEPRIEKFQLKDDKLKGLERPVTLIQVTDIHYGLFYDKSNLEGLVNRLNSIAGDAVIMTGDVFHTRQTNVESAPEVLAKLIPRKFGNFVVMGNHDFYTGENRSIAAFEASGLTVLRDEWRTFSDGSVFIHLAGLDDPKKNWLLGQQFPNFQDVMEKAPSVDGFRILLSHRPTVFPLASENGFELTLAGHTHGGQFVFPLGNSQKGWSPASVVSAFTHGWYEHGNSRMYLNRGAGLTFIPWRINCAPEIAVFELMPS